MRLRQTIQRNAQLDTQRNAQLTARHIARILCYVALALLPACQPQGPDAPFAKYLSKLSTALTFAATDQQRSAAQTPPLASTLQFALPASPVDSLDFLQLSGCAVQANIGKRQISLGKLAKPSQRLFLELEYLRLAPECISRLRTGNISGNSSGNASALADVLEKAWHQKQAQLPALIFNATLGSDEYRAFWLATPAPGDYPHSNADAVATAMGAINNQIQRWLSGDYGAHNWTFELQLSELAGGDGGARLQGWTQQIDWLAAADRVLERASEPLLSGHSRHAEERWCSAKYFTDTILPLTTRSQQNYQVVAAPAMALEAQLDAALPPHYRDWMEDRNQRVANLTHTPTRHLERLQRMQAACNPD